MSYSGVRSVRDVVILYLIVGMLCAAWRAAGTIPYAVSLCAKFMSPSIFILMSFLACCLMSTLMGTSTGTAATMGVICITLASALGADKVLAGGAILAGCFFGDRCSPMSGSAMLVANLTKTKVNHNVGRMARTAAVPFILSCLAYAVLGTTVNTSAVAPNVSGMFATTFHLSWLVTRSRNRCPVLPEGNGKTTMLASLDCACVLCLVLQGFPIAELPALLVFGYQCPDPAIASMLNGGGIVSMLNLPAIICISSTYSVLFQKSGLLNGVCTMIKHVANRYTPFVGVLLTSLVSNCMACNQTLSIILTDQICLPTERSGNALALDLKNSTVVMAGLVPWSLSSIAALSFIGVPTTSIGAAFFLYLLPLWTLLLSVVIHRKPALLKKSSQVLGLCYDDNASFDADESALQLAV